MNLQPNDDRTTRQMSRRVNSDLLLVGSAPKRTEAFSVSDGAIGLIRGSDGVVRVDVDQGVELRVDGGSSFQAGRHRLNRGDLAVSNRGGHLGGCLSP